YLSSSMLDRLQEKLIKGGYDEDTPAAIVYKATWPEEKQFICTVSTLYETVQKNGITKTAIVLVGDAVTHKNFDRSKLYDPSFTTGFRKGTS
ncbi:MAG: cobalt-precorrin-4 C(11)-methyltransferase, partial [Lachnospiraceae bacterium]|nr:cobalt-precorrin-4 C(11)-methyltransferase [Lachnospiraceae bacterium]